jgi:hypothetical protein
MRLSPKQNTHVYVCVGCEIDTFANEIDAFECVETWMGTLSDRLDIKFGSLEAMLGVSSGAGGGKKDRWAAAKWDHKHLSSAQVWYICMYV